MRKLILASKNIKKLKELKEILPAGWDAILATDINPTINWNESGDTFEANSRIKALAVRKFAQNAAVLADDSGLSVNALDGSPGVYSARFAGIEGDDAANNAKLLQALSKVPEENRSAHFTCCLCFIDESGKESFYEGKCFGTITSNPRGTHGFGYDPLFLIDSQDPSLHGLSMAEIPAETKNLISHRAIAMKKFLAALKDFLPSEV